MDNEEKQLSEFRITHHGNIFDAATCPFHGEETEILILKELTNLIKHCNQEVIDEERLKPLLIYIPETVHVHLREIGMVAQLTFEPPNNANLTMIHGLKGISSVLPVLLNLYTASSILFQNRSNRLLTINPIDQWAQIKHAPDSSLNTLEVGYLIYVPVSIREILQIRNIGFFLTYSNSTLHLDVGITHEIS